ASKAGTADQTIDYAGESRQIRREGSALTVTLGFAIALIYLVLAAQFQSFRDPLIVLLGSVPLAVSGALAFSFLDLTTLNIYSLLARRHAPEELTESDPEAEPAPMLAEAVT